MAELFQQEGTLVALDGLFGPSGVAQAIHGERQLTIIKELNTCTVAYH